MINLIRGNFQQHPYHLVSPSAWPVFTSFSLGILAGTGGISMHYFHNSYIVLYMATVIVIMTMVLWFRDMTYGVRSDVCVKSPNSGEIWSKVYPPK